MFVVCGKYTNNKLRVWDTDDNTVEPVDTVLNLKLVESMGYQVVFDEDQDYIYELWYSNFLDRKVVIDMLKSMPSNILSGMTNISLKFDSFGENRNVVTYLVKGNERVVLISISRHDFKYKMSINSDITRYATSQKISHISFYKWLLDMYPREKYILLSFDYGDDAYIMVFDLECNFIKLEDVRMVN